MEFLECVKNRRSIRKYKAEPVPKALLEKIVSAAAYAPSWKNVQTTRYIAILDSELRKDLADNCTSGFAWNQKIVNDAPAVILVTTITGRSGFERDGSFSTSKGAHWESFDAGIATQTLCLAAHNEGLGTVVLGVFDEEKIIKRVNIPEGQKLSALVAIGFPDETPDAPKRKDTESLLTIL